MLSPQFLKYDNFKLTILLTNEAQHHLILEIKQEFIDFLRKEIKNTNLNVEFEEHKESVTKKALTPSEKFNLMAEKNPLLKEFRKRLDLDPTFN